MKVIIADDESLARDRLRRLLGSVPKVEIVAECADGPSVVEAVAKHLPDLLLLDIQMPGKDGFEVVRALTVQPLPLIVFVTSYNQYALRAFESRAIDYLLKPTTRNRLLETIARVRERLSTQNIQKLPASLLELINESKPSTLLRRISVREGERTLFVPVEEVDWIEAAGNYVVIHVGSASHILRETMHALEIQLSPDTFFRISRSAIVNLRRAREIQVGATGDSLLLLSTGSKLAITRNLRELEERLRFT